MRNGPEIRITGTVTTVNADTSIVVTENENSQDNNLQTANRTVTLTQAATAGWRSGEPIEILVRSLGG